MKNILLVGGLLVVGAVYLGKQKVTEIRNVIDKLVMRVNGIHKFSIATTGVRFEINLSITNPTDQRLSLVTGNMITLRRLLFYSDAGEFIGESYPNLTGIEIPANGSITIPNLKTSIKTTNFGNLINNAIGVLTDPSKLKVKAEIESLGKTYTI